MRQRFSAAFIFIVLAALFRLFALAAEGKIDIGRLVNPCGLKQRYSLPCPTCEMTSSAVAFAKGRLFESFYIQPAAALLCCMLVVAAFFAFITAVFGVYFNFLKRFFAEVKVRYIILGLVIIIIAGWAVTLARALAAGN